MTDLYLIAAVVLFITLGGGMYQIVRGPTAADRMLAIQLFGTAAVAILILTGKAMNDPALVDVALVFALLAAVTLVAFVRCVWEKDIDEPHS